MGNPNPQKFYCLDSPYEDRHVILKNSQFWAKPETSITLTTSPPVNYYTNTLGNNSHSNSVINNIKQIGFTFLTADRRPTLSKFCGCSQDTEHLKSLISEKEQKLKCHV